MSSDRVITLADFRAAPVKRKRAPKRISPSTAQIQVLAYMVTATVEAAKNGIISRGAFDAIFDFMETLSLGDGEAPTEATIYIRQLYEKIIPGLPKGDDV